MKRKRGAPPGIKNAFRHSFYSSRFRQQEYQALSQTSALELAEEFALMRVATARLLPSLESPTEPRDIQTKLSIPRAVNLSVLTRGSWTLPPGRKQADDNAPGGPEPGKPLTGSTPATRFVPLWFRGTIGGGAANKEPRMPRLLVEQLRIKRGEWLRGLRGRSSDDARRRFGPVNCISGHAGHLVWHKQRTCLTRPQGPVLIFELNRLFACGEPLSAPALPEMMKAWRIIAAAADPFLDTLSAKALRHGLPLNGRPTGQTLGTVLLRTT